MLNISQKDHEIRVQWQDGAIDDNNTGDLLNIPDGDGWVLVDWKTSSAAPSVALAGQCEDMAKTKIEHTIWTLWSRPRTRNESDE